MTGTCGARMPPPPSLDPTLQSPFFRQSFLQREMASVYPSLSAFPACFRMLLPLWFLLLARVDAVIVNRREEVNALLSFKNANSAYTGAQWLAWNESDETPCAWLGVACTANYTVEELDFGGWGISVGSLDALFNLTDLRHLDLSFNHVAPWAGTEIGNLTGLTRLDLTSTHIGTDVLSSITTCRNLRYLALGQNGINYVPSGLSNLVSLQYLNLSFNKLSGQFPVDVLGRLTDLATLDLSENSDLNDTIPALPHLTSLGELVLANNNFTGFEVPWVLGTKLLRSLSVSNNQLGGGIPSSIANSTNLFILDLSNNSLSGSIPLGLFSQKNYLSSLDLSQNQLTGEIPPDILQVTSCASVNVSHNLLTGNIPGGGPVGSFCLALLDLSYNNLSGRVPSNALSSFQGNIDTLVLQNNDLSGDFVELLDSANWFPIFELRLANNLFTGDLSRMARPTIRTPFVMDLSNNQLQWSTSKAIPDPVKATLEVLTANQELTVFLVGGNNFSGTSLPTACFSNGTYPNALTFLDLSNCHLKGEISGSAFNSQCLQGIQLLNLSNNHATGPVPKSIISLSQPFSVVDVSNNNLSGPLPSIPSSSNLYNPKYFVGNEGLCGLPLTLCPGMPPKQKTGVQWWVILIVIGGCVTIAMGSCLAATWRWRMYQKQHQQDADLIRTLLERESAILMPLQAIRKATDNFADNAQIGEGGFGTVYVGKLNDGTLVAIKRSKQVGSDRDKQQFLNEVRILSQVNHRHLVKLLGCCMENKIAVLVFEFVSNGTLQEHLQGRIGATHLSWKQRLNIAIQTADALYYLHSVATSPIFHRDVKSANILLDENLDAKVADFGISKLAPLHATHVSTAIQGTMGYIDPEYYTSFQLTDKSDVYGFGVVLLELISAKPALDFGRGGDNTSLVNLARPFIEREGLENFIDPILVETYRDPTCPMKESILNAGQLAMKCLDMQSRARPSMKEVVKELQIVFSKFSDMSKNLDPCLDLVSNRG